MRSTKMALKRYFARKGIGVTPERYLAEAAQVGNLMHAMIVRDPNNHNLPFMWKNRVLSKMLAYVTMAHQRYNDADAQPGNYYDQKLAREIYQVIAKINNMPGIYVPGDRDAAYELKRISEHLDYLVHKIRQYSKGNY